MSMIKNSDIRVIDVPGGVFSLPVNKNCTHHKVAVSGATGDVALKEIPHGLADARTFDGNTLAQNTGAVFVLGSLDAIEVHPANAGVSYKISVSSF